jgi:hypothetical protein
MFLLLVRDQEDGGSNPLAPTNPFATRNLWTVRPPGAKPGGQWLKLQCVALAEGKEASSYR